jgi:hypothetical protein
MSCRQVYRYQRFGVAGCLHAQGSPRRVTWTFVPIHQSTRQLIRLVSSSAPLQEPQIAHTHRYPFTDTKCVWIPSSNNFYVAVTDLRLPFESILAIIAGSQKANSNCIQLQGLVIIYIYVYIHTHTHTDSTPRLYGNVTERHLDKELHYSKICLKLKLNYTETSIHGLFSQVPKTGKALLYEVKFRPK